MNLRSARPIVLAVTSLGIASLAAAVASADRRPPRDAKTVTVTVDVGTNLAATVSPDGRTIVMDLQGVLWSVPIGGGTATRLTDDLLQPARPDYAPGGGWVVFQAYAGGTFHIWRMKPDGGSIQQLTSGHGDDRAPRFSPDGTKIVFSSDRAFAGSYDIWVLDLANGNALTRLTSNDGLEEFEPTWSPDGSRIAFVSGTSSTGARIEEIDGLGNRSTLVTAPPGSRVNSPAWSPDGRRLAYVQFANNKSRLEVRDVVTGTTTAIGTARDHVFPFYPQWLSNDVILYTADGKIQISNLSAGTIAAVPFTASFQLKRAEFARKSFDFNSSERRRAKGIVGPTLSPDGTVVAFEALNQIWLMPIGGKPVPITDDRYYKTDPAWSRDARHGAGRRGGIGRLVTGRKPARFPGPDRRDVHHRVGHWNGEAGHRS